MIRSAPASQGSMRAAVERDLMRGGAGSAELTVRHMPSMLVGLAVVAAIFADLARTSVVPAGVPDESPFPGAHD